MKKSQKYLLLLTSAISLAAISFFILLITGIDLKIANRAIINSNEYESFKDLKEIIALYEKIDEEYYKEIDKSLLSEGAVRGMFAILPDGYSRYYSKEELESKKLRDKGGSIGIGIKIQRNKNKEFVIIEVVDERPAAKAGLMVGDKILSVNDIELSDDSYEEVLLSLKNQNKEYLLFGNYIQAKIIVRRDGKTLEFLVDRDLVVERSVSVEVYDNIGYIKIDRFIETTYDDYFEAISRLNKENVDKLILDLRANPGGLVDEASKIAGSIVGKNKVVYYTNSKKEELKEHRSQTDKKFSFDIVLLVDEKSASSSEILAGALKDHGSVRIVGTTTFGKGIIQTTFSRLGGDGYQITTSEYLTPNKDPIHKIGVKPHRELAEGEDALEIAKELLDHNDGK